MNLRHLAEETVAALECGNYTAPSGNVKKICSTVRQLSSVLKFRMAGTYQRAADEIMALLALTVTPKIEWNSP